MFDFIAVPFGYVMRYIYEGVGNYGLSIILFTVLTQVIMLPINWKQKKGMMDMQRIQPKLLDLQKKYANNREKYAQEVQKLYDEEDVSPFSGCLPMMLTLPIMMGLYYVVAQPLRYFMGLSADQISQMAELLNVTSKSAIQMQAEVVAQYYNQFSLLSQHFEGLMRVNFNFLGLNLALTPSLKQFGPLWIMPVISGATAFLQTYVMRMMQKRQGVMPDDASANASNAMMNIMMPAMSIYFGFILPAGLSLYWIARNLITTLQELILSPYFIRKGKEKEAMLLAEQEAKRKRRQQRMAQQQQWQREQAKGKKGDAEGEDPEEDGEEPGQDEG